MNSIQLTAAGITKSFERRPVLRNVSFDLTSPDSLAVTGKNGAGKSTLSKILLGLIRPSGGSIAYAVDGRNIDGEEFKQHAGFVSPYLNMYDEFSAVENLRILARIRGKSVPDAAVLQDVLRRVDLWHRKDDAVGTYSSGMKQRLKYAFALLHRPAMLVLDEPTSNLDADGVAMVERIAKEQKMNGILIIATNNPEEAGWCSRQILVGPGEDGEGSAMIRQDGGAR